MTLYRVMAVLQGETNLPEDRFVNTFHFQNAGTLGKVTEDMAEITQRLFAFYETINTETGQAITDFIPASVITSDIQFRIYDLADPEPREPSLFTAAITPAATIAMPTEVAICVSYYAERNIPRRRGRVYIGPLTVSASTDNIAGKGGRPTDQLVNTLAAAAGRLQAASIGDELQWCLRSAPEGGPEAALFITDGWVDNAFDTQRRRGTAASTRALWGMNLP